MAERGGEGEYTSPEQDQAVGRALVARPGSEVATARSTVPARAVSWDEQDIPYEQLVANVRLLVEQARARHRRGHPDGSFSANEPFEPAEWLGWHLHQEAFKDNDLREGHHPRYDLANAWDALYYTRYPAEGGGWSQYMRSLLETHVDMTKQTSLTLSPKCVTLLDAMAEATGLPRKKGEATIDLTPFARPGGTPRPQPGENKNITRRTLR